jgi:Transposase
MAVIFSSCAGLDVHQWSVMACRITPDPTGQQADGVVEVKELTTLLHALLALSDWLATAGITHVPMESTGEYWKPIVNLLVGNFQVFLVNASHVKRVPGRKTDTEVVLVLYDLAGGLIPAVRVGGRPQRRPTPLVQLWCIALAPAQHRGGVDPPTACPQKLFHVVVAQRIAHILSHRTAADVGLNMAPWEQGGSAQGRSPVISD